MALLVSAVDAPVAAEQHGRVRHFIAIVALRHAHRTDDDPRVEIDCHTRDQTVRQRVALNAVGVGP